MLSIPSLIRKKETLLKSYAKTTIGFIEYPVRIRIAHPNERESIPRNMSGGLGRFLSTIIVITTQNRNRKPQVNRKFAFRRNKNADKSISGKGGEEDVVDEDVVVFVEVAVDVVVEVVIGLSTTTVI